MATTYDKIATTTLGSASSTITFSSIPATYTDLRVILTFKSDATGAGNQINAYYNADNASTNYSTTMLIGNGITASSIRASNNATMYWGDWRLIGASSTIPQSVIVDIFSYAGSTYKTCLIATSSDYNGSGGVFREVTLWRSISAITTITMPIGAGNLAAGTTATLYGIKAA